METTVKLFSNKNGEIYRFLNNFYSFTNDKKNEELVTLLEWEKTYQNPIEMADIIGTFIDNNNSYQINMWISLDKDILINVTDNNVDDIIKYLYERFPY